MRPLDDNRWYWVVRDTDQAVVIMAPGELLPVARMEMRSEEESGVWAQRICEAMNREANP